MRRWMAAPVAFAAAAALALVSESQPVLGQEKPVEETFATADGVRLKGLFHKSAKPAPGNPVAILLYPPGPNNTMDNPGDWAGLTKTLNDGGFHVFRFDWRGHGQSTDITDTDLFWNNQITGPWNRMYIKDANKKPIKNDFKVKADLAANSRYFPVYVNDLAAARMHLDGKNDQGDLNTGSVYLVGAGDAAAIGMLWMAAEWIRPAIHPLLGGGLAYKIVPMRGIVVDPEAGRDIAGAIWLSASKPTLINDGLVRDWSKNARKLRDNNPMLFLYGGNDKAGHDNGKFFFDQVLVAKGNKQLDVKPLEQTFLTEIKGSKLSGAALLGNDAMLGTETTIMKYLESRQKDRKAVVRKMRNYPGPYFIDLGWFGLRP